MKIKEIEIENKKIYRYRICKKNQIIKFLGGPTNTTYYIYNSLVGQEAKQEKWLPSNNI